METLLELKTLQKNATNDYCTLEKYAMHYFGIMGPKGQPF